MKNLIFAADGPKPRIVLRDAINNDLEIAGNAGYCLVYDRPLADRPRTPIATASRKVAQCDCVVAADSMLAVFSSAVSRPGLSSGTYL
jgi:hypothetical protein